MLTSGGSFQVWKVVDEGRIYALFCSIIRLSKVASESLQGWIIDCSPIEFRWVSTNTVPKNGGIWMTQLSNWYQHWVENQLNRHNLFCSLKSHSGLNLLTWKCPLLSAAPRFSAESESSKEKLVDTVVIIRWETNRLVSIKGTSQ